MASSSATAEFTGIRTVFLDRDGVINRKAPEGEYIARWGDFHFLPGAEEAIAALNGSGRRVIVATNQRGVALGRYTSGDVDALHGELQRQLGAHGARIDAIYICAHDKDECDCRKPKTGLFEQAFRDFPEASAATSVMIGDSLSDIEAARRLGMRSIFIEGDPETQKAGAGKAAALADAVCGSLVEAVREFLA
jgi:D-glycero-D-manno-heptose 1,7-bisphosphate phosphatase